MAIQNFKPEVWSAELLVALETSLVYAGPGVVNRDYEGEISDMGDTVHVSGVVDPTIGDYTPYTEITLDQPEDTGDMLVINQSKFWGIEVDDVDKKQARADFVTEITRRGAYKLRDVADRYVGGLMATSVDTGNVLDSQTITDPEDAYNTLVDLGVLLDEADVPTEQRFAIITPAFHGLLLKDDRFIAAGDADGAGVRANGMIGTAAGFSLRKSNNAPANPDADGKLVIAGHPMATSYAEQINKTEAARKEKGFADIVKGLHLYGAKVFRPKALAAADVVISR